MHPWRLHLLVRRCGDNTSFIGVQAPPKSSEVCKWHSVLECPEAFKLTKMTILQKRVNFFLKTTRRKQEEKTHLGVAKNLRQDKKMASDQRSHLQ